jgi:hypothetical protein
LAKGLPYEINRNHLHHLHLAVNPDPNAKGMKMIADTGKSILPVLLIGIVFVMRNKNAQEYLKKVTKWNS